MNVDGRERLSQSFPRCREFGLSKLNEIVVGCGAGCRKLVSPRASQSTAGNSLRPQSPHFNSACHELSKGLDHELASH